MLICMCRTTTLDCIEEKLLIKSNMLLQYISKINIAQLISIEMPAYTFLHLFSDGLIFVNLRCEKWNLIILICFEFFSLGTIHSYPGPFSV